MGKDQIGDQAPCALITLWYGQDTRTKGCGEENYRGAEKRTKGCGEEKTLYFGATVYEKAVTSAMDNNRLKSVISPSPEKDGV